MVKRFLLLILATVLLVGIASYAIAQNKSQDPTIQNPSPYSDTLPEAYRAIIISADSVEWMIIDGWTPNDSLMFRLGEPIGEILSSHFVKDSIAKEQIKDLLLSPGSFQADSLVKECTYIPDFGVLFISGSDSLYVSYSIYCDMCRFQSKDEFWDFDGTFIRNDFLKILRNEFPKDKYIRNITRRL